MTKHTKRMDKLYRTTYPILMRGLARDLIEYFRKREEVNSNLEETTAPITGEKLVTTETDQQPTLAAVLSTAFSKNVIDDIIRAIEDGDVKIDGLPCNVHDTVVADDDEITIDITRVAHLRELEEPT